MVRTYFPLSADRRFHLSFGGKHQIMGGGCASVMEMVWWIALSSLRTPAHSSVAGNSSNANSLLPGAIGFALPVEHRRYCHRADHTYQQAIQRHVRAAQLSEACAAANEQGRLLRPRVPRLVPGPGWLPPFVVRLQFQAG